MRLIRCGLLLIFVGLSAHAQRPKPRVARVSADPKAALTFLAMGDWGMQGIPSQVAVARSMAKVSSQSGAAFIITTGDNFYDDGVASETDSGWAKSYEEVYSAPSLQKPWYVALGNHDYRGNVDAEIAYEHRSKRWHLPARYYAKKFSIGSGKEQLLMVFIDTDPFFAPYYDDDKYEAKVRAQDTALQKHWIDSVLADNTVRWKIVVGHHPVITGGPKKESDDVRSVHDALQPLLDKHRVDAYICGHAHYLEYLKPPGATHYFITGAAAEAKQSKLYPAWGKYASKAGQYGFMTFRVSHSAITAQIIDTAAKPYYTIRISHK